MRNMFGLLAVLTLCAQAGSLSAADVEIVTYYPAPWGEYKEVRAERMVIGKVGAPSPNPDDTVTIYGNTQINSWLNTGSPQPPKGAKGLFIDGKPISGQGTAQSGIAAAGDNGATVIRFSPSFSQPPIVYGMGLLGGSATGGSTMAGQLVPLVQAGVSATPSSYTAVFGYVPPSAPAAGGTGGTTLSTGPTSAGGTYPSGILGQPTGVTMGPFTYGPGGPLGGGDRSVTMGPFTYSGPSLSQTVTASPDTLTQMSSTGTTPLPRGTPIFWIAVERSDTAQSTSNIKR